MKEIISQTAKNLGGVISKNSPTILTGLGVGGLATTAVLTGTATVKAVRLVDEINQENSQSEYAHRLTKKEIIGLSWKFYIPAIAMGILTGTCIIGSNSINQRRNAALSALYSLSETAFREYKEKVVEEIGKNKELKIRDNVMQDKITNNPVGDKTVFVTGYGDVLCYDKLSDRYFKSSPEKIRQQVLAFSYDLISEEWLDLNELYYMMGLEPCKLGSSSGFDSNHTVNGVIEVQESSHLTPDGIPCFAFDATVYPKYTR